MGQDASTAQDANAAHESHVSEHASTLVETADEIAELGHDARRIDRFVARADEGRVDVATLVADTLDDAESNTSSVTVTVDAPQSLELVTNQEALRAALESALENALDYAQSEVTITVQDGDDNAVIRVRDDGPGIPDGELDSLDHSVETPLRHGTGLGLWQLKWAVTTLGGDLSFDTTDGTTVEIVVPDRSQRVTTPPT